MEPPNLGNLRSPAIEEQAQDMFLSGGNPAANPYGTPLLTNSAQSIESVFSRLNLSSDARFHAQETSSSSRPATIGDWLAVPSPSRIPPPMAFGGYQQDLIWAPSSSSNTSFNGPIGAHRRIDVGPDFSGRGPYLHVGDHNQLMLQQQYNQRQEIYDATSDNLERYILHGKQPISTHARYNVPILPFARENNSFASTNFPYADRDPYELLQHLTLQNMRGRVVSFAKNQVLSEILNLKLEEGLSENEIEMVLLELIGSCSDLLRNQFGSEFVQKLFAVCNEDQRTRIVIALTKLPYNLVTVCLNSFGARAIQKLLENMNAPQQISLIVSSLTPGALHLATDPNGQHVIHYCVKGLPEEYTKHLLNEIASNCCKIATHKIGCRVLQSCVENSNGEARRVLISEIITDAVHLAEDPYGNYVVQHLLDMKMPEVTKYLLKRFQGYFVFLSCNKYASNVVENMLNSGEEISSFIIMELLRSPNASMLLLDPFGNFVIQSALSVSKGRALDLLLNLIRVNAHSMESNLYGKKILAWFEKKKIYIV